MTRNQILEEISMLELEEERIKQLMRWYATYPEFVPGGKKAADEFINMGLEKLRIIRELQYFWREKLKDL